MNIESVLDNLPYIQQHPWLKFLLLMASYGFFAIAVNFFIKKVLHRFTQYTKSTIDDQILKKLPGPIFITVLVVGIIHCFSLLALEDTLFQILSKAGRSLILVVWLITLIRVIGMIAQKPHTLLHGKIGRDLVLVIDKIVFILIFILGSYWLLAIWNVDLTPLLASAGIAGIAVAMAAKDTLANFFGGISLTMDRVFTVGDYIIIDNQERGEVVEIGIRSSRILTRDDVLVTIPNSILANSKIINESAPTPNFRIKVPVGVAYDSDLDHVESVLLDIAAKSTGIAKDPAPRVRVRNLADSSVNFELLVWVADPRERGLQTHLFLKKIHKTLQEKNITIPFPQIDVHLNKSVKKQD